ncbi:hypothetical protein [Lolliginicoccus suaedae]|uniref:hypothetical protein n=1 Tax=Lolliginicoccus suaedae TaxID=2605429 RepID=UPI0016597BFA|nr:hypothetical protein [Lolliginicoccus suaedae]
MTEPEDPRERARRRARLDAVFGDVLPEERASTGTPSGADDSQLEQWLRENKPPHH